MATPSALRSPNGVATRQMKLWLAMHGGLFQHAQTLLEFSLADGQFDLAIGVGQQVL